MTIKEGWYKHFKGEYYYALDTATHTETGEEMVIYYHKGEPKLWVRPASMWHELVNGEPRFKYIEDNTVSGDDKTTYCIEPEEVHHE